ncbi:MAG: MFS transporter [Bacteroidetes bacterium]|nr:MFS transporter [Bacteroidota bacterium]
MTTPIDLDTEKKGTFSKYEIFVIVLLAFIQFSVVLDFMVLAPLGYHLMPALNMTKADFGNAVAAYAFSACLSGFLVAGFADKFDRKKLLVFFYIGFIIGTFLCARANTYEFLVFARIVTGLFGGVIASISNAIVTDTFQLHVRGRVMGMIQIAFAASNVLGIPFGLYFTRTIGWHIPFLMIVAVSIVVVVIVFAYLKPVDAHLKIKSDKNPLQHLIATISNKNYLVPFLATTLLATGGYMLMPYGSDFGVHNLGISEENLTYLYMLTGVATIAVMPLAGTLSDKVGKYKVFFVGSIASIVVICIYGNLSVTPFWIVVVLNILLMSSIMSRIAPSQALMSAVPDQKDRGAFMSINSSVMYLAGGISAFIAGKIVGGEKGGFVENYDILCYVVSGAIIVTLILMYFVNKQVEKKIALHKKV